MEPWLRDAQDKKIGALNLQRLLGCSTGAALAGRDKQTLAEISTMPEGLPLLGQASLPKLFPNSFEKRLDAHRDLAFFTST